MVQWQYELREGTPRRFGAGVTSWINGCAKRAQDPASASGPDGGGGGEVSVTDAARCFSVREGFNVPSPPWSMGDVDRCMHVRFPTLEEAMRVCVGRGCAGIVRDRGLPCDLLLNIADNDAPNAPPKCVAGGWPSSDGQIVSQVVRQAQAGSPPRGYLPGFSILAPLFVLIALGAMLG